MSMVMVAGFENPLKPSLGVNIPVTINVTSTSNAIISGAILSQTKAIKERKTIDNINAISKVINKIGHEI